MQYLQQSLLTTSLWLMVLLSFERSFTFIRPYTVKKVFGVPTTYTIIIVLICFCFGFHIDELVSVDAKAFRWVNFAYGLCSIDRYSSLVPKHIVILIHSQLFILPFLLNSILDVYICCCICRQNKRLFKNSVAVFPNNKSRRLKISLANEITLTLLCQSMWLLMTCFPIDLYYLLISSKVVDDYDRDNLAIVFFIRYNLLIYLTFSPTLYVVLSPTLRKEIHSHIFRLYKQHKPTSRFYMPSKNKRLEKVLTNYQVLPCQQAYVTVLIRKTDPLSIKFIPSTLKIPKKCVIKYKSKSLGCLLTCTNDKERKRYVKNERSLTFYK